MPLPMLSREYSVEQAALYFKALAKKSMLERKIDANNEDLSKFGPIFVSGNRRKTDTPRGSPRGSPNRWSMDASAIIRWQRGTTIADLERT